jgi:hypothetical protein
MVRLSRFQTRRPERGITLALVAISIVALFGVAALLIDVVTLYVARADAQRVANAAALAGAKALVDGGVTADPTDSANDWDTACDMATVQAQKIAGTSTIGGVTATLPTGNVLFGANALPLSASCPTSGSAGNFGVNPHVGVTVQSAPLPLFFAKILGPASARVSATGLAEGFNSSGTSVPVTSKGVMPWLIPNADPNGGLIIDTSGGTTDGQIVKPGPTGIIGEEIALTMGCTGGCGTLNSPAVSGSKSTYYPLDLNNPSSSLPSCFGAGTTYEMNVAVNNPTPMKCGVVATLDPSVASTDVANETALECRIGASSNGLGKGVAATNVISISRSVVTIPVYDAGASPYAVPVSPVVIGFVQGFVESASGGDPTIKVLNVSGCGTTARAAAAGVGSDGESAVPVRLIHP